MLHRFENLCAWLLGTFLELIFCDTQAASAVERVRDPVEPTDDEAEIFRPYSLRRPGDWHFRHATDPEWRAF